MNKTENIKQYAKALRLPTLAATCDELIHQAQIDAPSYLEYTESMLSKEIEQRQKNDFEKRMKTAKLHCVMILSRSILIIVQELPDPK